MEIFRRIGIMSLLCTALVLQLEAQQTTAGPLNEPSGTASTVEEPIPPAVMKEPQAMKKRIEQLEAELSKRDAHQPPTQLVEETASGPGVPDTRIGSASFVQPQGESTTPATTQPEQPQTAEPFAFTDWTWLNGTARTKTPAFDSKFFTPEIRADVDYIYDFRHPKDDTIGERSFPRE
jgi:hypothetical protein